MIVSYIDKEQFDSRYLSFDIYDDSYSGELSLSFHITRPQTKKQKKQWKESWLFMVNNINKEMSWRGWTFIGSNITLRREEERFYINHVTWENDKIKDVISVITIPFNKEMEKLCNNFAIYFDPNCGFDRELRFDN